MKPLLRVFVDSDVVISSTISKNGAAYFASEKTELAPWMRAKTLAKRAKEETAQLAAQRLHYLISQSDDHFFISNLSRKEVKLVSERLKLGKKGLTEILKRFKTVKISKNKNRVGLNFGKYVIDPNDAHVVAGAVAAKARFLISYNLRHFKIDRIKRDFGILLLSPAMFLQYLRSRRLITENGNGS